MTTEELAEIIEHCGQGWVLKDNRQATLEFAVRKLTDVQRRFAEKFSDPDDGIVLDDVSLKSEPDSYRVSALIQALPSRSVDFIAGIWRIVHGDRIASLEMEYVAIKSFKLRVTIESRHNGKPRLREFESDRIEDAAFVRHLWIGRVNDKPFFAGYFPPRQRQNV